MNYTVNDHSFRRYIGKMLKGIGALAEEQKKMVNLRNALIANEF